MRLEEQVVNFRKGLYQEAVYSSSKRNLENLNDSIEPNSIRSSKHQRSKSLSLNEFNLTTTTTPSRLQVQPPISRSVSSRKLLFSADTVGSDNNNINTPGKQLHRKQNSISSIAEEGRGKENLSFSNAVMKGKQSPEKRTPKASSPVKKTPVKQESAEKLQVTCMKFILVTPLVMLILNVVSHLSSYLPF